MAEFDIEAIAERFALCVVRDHVVDGVVHQVVSSRDLHRFLEVRTRHRAWVKRRLEAAGAVVGVDAFLIYVPQEYGDGEVQLVDVAARPNLSGGSHVPGPFDGLDYLITVDWAKHVCMMEKTEVARLLRMYFIEVERRYLASATAALTRSIRAEERTAAFRKLSVVDATMSVSRYVRARGVSVRDAAKIRLLALEHENDLLRTRRLAYLDPVGRDHLDGEFVYSLFDLSVWWDPLGIEMWRRFAPAAAQAYLDQVRRTEAGPAALGPFGHFDVSREELRLVAHRLEYDPPM